jgi:hypothetical protein
LSIRGGLLPCFCSAAVPASRRPGNRKERIAQRQFLLQPEQIPAFYPHATTTSKELRLKGLRRRDFFDQPPASAMLSGF